MSDSNAAQYPLVLLAHLELIPLDTQIFRITGYRFGAVERVITHKGSFACDYIMEQGRKLTLRAPNTYQILELCGVCKPYYQGEVSEGEEPRFMVLFDGDTGRFLIHQYYKGDNPRIVQTTEIGSKDTKFSEVLANFLTFMDVWFPEYKSEFNKEKQAFVEAERVISTKLALANMSD